MKQAPGVMPEDLVNYGYFNSLDEVPANAQKLIMFASDIVMSSVRNNYDKLSESHVLAVKKAICCQVSYWVETGTNPVDQSEVSSYSLGELSVSVDKTSASQGTKPALCQMSLMYLRDAYLLYRGLRHGRM